MAPFATFAKDGYKITFTATGNSDSALYMGYYVAQHRFFLDTAYNNGKGTFVFKGSRELTDGLYYITNNRDHYVPFVIYREEPRFTLRTDNNHWKLSMTVKHSDENEVFFNFHRAEETLYQEGDQLRATLDSAQFDSVVRPRLIRRLDSLRMSFVEQYPQRMIAKMLLATKDIDIPRKAEDGTPLTQRQRFDYLMAHYFDNMPLDDPFILHTPKEIFYDRVMNYVDGSMRGMPPELICPLLDSLIDRAKPAPEVYRWLILNLTNHFLQSRVMVYDEVYVHLVQRYFATGQVTNLEPSVIDEQIERADRWQHLLVGRVAPELILFDTLHHPFSLHHMPGRYTLLIFWSPTCGHCRDIIPAVYNLYNSYADSLDLSAFVILTEPDEQTTKQWRSFLLDHHIDHPRWINLSGGEANVDWRDVYDVHTTPQTYLIENEKHTIYAKKLDANIFERVLQALNQ